MLAKYPLGDVTPAADTAAALLKQRQLAEPVQLPQNDVIELIHLARAVLLKSPEDLAAIAGTAPALPEKWIAEFAAERQRAEAEAKFWSAAIAYLMAVSPGSIANDG